MPQSWSRGYVVGSNLSAVYWMDIFHIDLLLKLVYLKRPKINKKRPGLAYFFKKCHNPIEKITATQSH